MRALSVFVILAYECTSLEHASQCPVLEAVDGLHCYGLEDDERPKSALACSEACCADELCEAWQFQAEQGGCFRGRPQVCLPSPSSFARDAVGAWIRKKERWGDSIQATSNMQWMGDSSNFNTFEPVDPYASGPDTMRSHGPDGEQYLFRRHGPGLLDLDVSMTCWSRSRTPEKCCQSETRNCWDEFRGHVEYRERCCSYGATPVQAGEMTTMFEVFLMISAHMTTAELKWWDDTIPKVVIDESAFEKKRNRWRVGNHESGTWCPHTAEKTSVDVAAIGGLVQDGPGDIRMLIHHLNASGVPLSRTFINIGAGTCKPPDPLYQLTHSIDGVRFAGLAVDANADDLAECARTYTETKAPVTMFMLLMAIDPLTVAMNLRPHLPSIFDDVSNLTEQGQPLPLDVLVVDIDGCDCLVTEEMLQFVQPKILVMEIAFHIPPPFRFSMQYDTVRSPEWQEGYNVRQFNPASGCSLSFAIDKFRPYGYMLSHLTDQDAVFVHSSVAPALEDSLGIRLPQDEFSCYRKSRLWMQMPATWVREWFFADHPAESVARIWSNMSRMNKMIERSDAPLSLDY